jgi:hypothetical protein
MFKKVLSTPLFTIMLRIENHTSISHKSRTQIVVVFVMHAIYVTSVCLKFKHTELKCSRFFILKFNLFIRKIYKKFALTINESLNNNLYIGYIIHDDTS